MLFFQVLFYTYTIGQHTSGGLRPNQFNIYLILKSIFNKVIRLMNTKSLSLLVRGLFQNLKILKLLKKIFPRHFWDVSEMINLMQ